MLLINTWPRKEAKYSKQADEPKKDINSLATDKQIKAIYALLKNKNYSEESLKNYINKLITKIVLQH